jgi:hypothetical protein
VCQQIRFVNDPKLKEGQSGRSQKLTVDCGAVPFGVGGYLVDHALAERPIFGPKELALPCSLHLEAFNGRSTVSDTLCRGKKFQARLAGENSWRFA